MVSIDRDILEMFIRSEMVTLVGTVRPEAVASFLLLAEDDQNAQIKTWASSHFRVVQAEAEELEQRAAEKASMAEKLEQAQSIIIEAFEGK